MVKFGTWPHFALVFHNRAAVASHDKHQILSEMLLELLTFVNLALQFNDMELMIVYEDKEHTLEQWQQFMRHFVEGPNVCLTFDMPEFIPKYKSFSAPEIFHANIEIGDFPIFSEIIAEMLVDAVKLAQKGISLIGADVKITVGENSYSVEEFTEGIISGRLRTDQAIPNI